MLWLNILENTREHLANIRNKAHHHFSMRDLKCYENSSYRLLCWFCLAHAGRCTALFNRRRRATFSILPFSEEEEKKRYLYKHIYNVERCIFNPVLGGLWDAWNDNDGFAADSISRNMNADNSILSDHLFIYLLFISIADYEPRLMKYRNIGWIWNSHMAGKGSIKDSKGHHTSRFNVFNLVCCSASSLLKMITDFRSQ